MNLKDYFKKRKKKKTTSPFVTKVYNTFAVGSSTSNITQEEIYTSEDIPENHVC